MYAHLTPAYGRDYRNAKQIREALTADLDFIFHDPSRGSTYINLPQLREAGFTTLQVRYAGLRRVTSIKVASL
jgi:hypothetical protein